MKNLLKTTFAFTLLFASFGAMAVNSEISWEFESLAVLEVPAEGWSFE